MRSTPFIPQPRVLARVRVASQLPPLGKVLERVTASIESIKVKAETLVFLPVAPVFPANNNVSDR